MPSKNKHVQGQYYVWKLYTRDGVYYADGRSNQPSAGRPSLGTRNAEQALRNLKQLDYSLAVQAGKAIDLREATPHYDDLTLEQGVKQYLEYVGRPRSAKGCSKQTVQRYRAIFDKCVEHFKTKHIVSWRQVGKSEIEDYAKLLDNQGYAAAGQVMEMVTIKQLINYFVKENKLPSESRFILDIDKDKESHTYCYTEEEVAAMIEHTNGDPKLHWLRDVIVALAHSGMRIGELAQLRWTDVRFDSNNIQVLDNSRRSPFRQLRTTKGRRSRTVPIHPSLLSVLERLNEANKSGYVFRAQKGGQILPRNTLDALIKKVIEPLSSVLDHSDAQEPGFSDGRLHSLRHYFVSWCANKGVAERVAMEWVGHNDSAMVKRYYHLVDSEAQRQMRLLANTNSSTTSSVVEAI